MKKKVYLWIILFSILTISIMMGYLIIRNYNRITENNKKVLLANLEKCYAILDNYLNEEQKLKFKAESEDKLYNYHFGLGLWIRNYLVKDFPEIADSMHRVGIYHRDDVSGIIIRSYHRHLNNTDINVEELIKHYKDFWKKENIFNYFFSYIDRYNEYDIVAVIYEVCFV